MYLEEPKLEFVEIDPQAEVVTQASVPCTENSSSGQGGTSCIGNAEHSHGSGCDDTAPLIT